MAGTVLKANNFDYTASPLSVANSGPSGNDAFGAVNVGTGNTVATSTSSPLSGTGSLLLTQAAANIIEIYWALASTTTDFYAQCEYEHKTPAANYAFLRTLATTAFTTAVSTLFIRTDNKVHLFNVSQLATSAGALTVGAVYIFEYQESGTTARVRFTPKGGTTPTIDTTWTIPTTTVGSCRWGIGTASTGLTNLKLDNFKIGTGGFLPRTDVSNTAPVASVGADLYVVAGTVVNLTGTDSDVDGTVTSRAWTWDTTDTSGPAGTTRKWAAGPTITGNTSQNATATMATPGAYRAKYVVTDDVGTASADVWQKVFVFPASTVAAGVRDGVKGTWTTFGSGATDTVRLNDASDATGWTAPSDPTGQAATLLLNPVGPGRGSGAITVTLRGFSTGGNIAAAVEFYKADGTTLLSTGSKTAPTSIAGDTYAMSDAGLAAIPALSDSAELVVKIKPTAF